jgi:hypothetical protein
MEKPNNIKTISNRQSQALVTDVGTVSKGIHAKKMQNINQSLIAGRTSAFIDVHPQSSVNSACIDVPENMANKIKGSLVILFNTQLGQETQPKEWLLKNWDYSIPDISHVEFSFPADKSKEVCNITYASMVVNYLNDNDVAKVTLPKFTDMGDLRQKCLNIDENKRWWSLACSTNDDDDDIVQM